MTELQIKARLFEISEALFDLQVERDNLLTEIKDKITKLRIDNPILLYSQTPRTIAEEIRELSQNLVDNLSKTQALLEEEDTLREKLEEVQQ